MNSQQTSDKTSEIYVWGDDFPIKSDTREEKKGCFYRFFSLDFAISSISCGQAHAIFLTKAGLLYTMGSNEHGCLGIGSFEPKFSETPCFVESLSKHKVKEISAGQRHNGVLLDNGKVFLWGDGKDGQLGNGELFPMNFPTLLPKPESFLTAVSCGGAHSMVITVEGKVHVFGSNSHGQLGTGDSSVFPLKFPMVLTCISEKILEISCGVSHTLFLTESRKVFACGDNSYGKLGIGTKKNSNIPVKLMFLENTPVKTVKAKEFSAALTVNGELYVWGHPKKQLLFPEIARKDGVSLEKVELAKDFAICKENNGKISCWGRDFNENSGFSQGFHDVLAEDQRSFQGVSCGNRGFFAFVERKPGETQRNRESFAEKVQNKRNFCRNFMKSSGNLAKASQKDGQIHENIEKLAKNEENVANVARNGKSLTPVRHLTSEEIRNRQKNSLHNPKKMAFAYNLSTNDNETLDETLGNEQNYAINPVNEEKLQVLLKNSKELQRNVVPNLNLRAVNEGTPKYKELLAKKSEKSEKYARFLNENAENVRTRLTSRYLVGKIEEKREFPAKFTGNEPESRDFKENQREMRELIEKVQSFEKEHNLLGDARLEQEKLRKSREELEKKCENLEKEKALLLQENQRFLKENRDFEEKLAGFAEKLAQKDQDIRFLKTENLKLTNLLDKTAKTQGNCDLEANFLQLSENLKNLEDENKFLENNLQNKDSLLEKLKRENEEITKKLRKMEADSGKYEEIQRQMRDKIQENEQLVASLGQDRENIVAEVEKFNKTLQEKDARTQEFLAKLEEKDREIATKDQEIAMKTQEIERIFKTFQQEKEKVSTLELELLRFQDLLRKKPNIPPLFAETNKINEKTHEISKDFRDFPLVSPSFSGSNKENVVFKGKIEEKSENSRNTEYFSRKKPRDSQKQFNLQNSCKGLAIEKSFSANKSEENSETFSTNFSEIKSKLTNLQRNKLLLESRMKDFERKVRESRSVAE